MSLWPPQHATQPVWGICSNSPSLAQLSSKAKFLLARRVCKLEENRTSLDLTLPLNRIKEAINSRHTKAGEKLSGTLINFPGPSISYAPWHEPCTQSCPSHSSTAFQSGRGCYCKRENTHIERIELA